MGENLQSAQYVLIFYLDTPSSDNTTLGDLSYTCQLPLFTILYSKLIILPASVE